MDKSFFPILISLLRGVNRKLEDDLSKSARELGVTITELNFLWTIHYEKEATVSRIATLTLLDASTVTQVLSRLKKKKLVTIRKKDEDQRYSYVQLSNEGSLVRKASMVYRQDSLLNFLISETKKPGGKMKVETTLEYLRQINLHFHGNEFVDWVYSLDEKLRDELP